MLPVSALADERRDSGSAGAEENGAQGNALGIIPMRRDRGTLAGRSAEAETLLNRCTDVFQQLEARIDLVATEELRQTILLCASVIPTRIKKGSRLQATTLLVLDMPVIC